MEQLHDAQIRISCCLAAALLLSTLEAEAGLKGGSPNRGGGKPAARPSSAPKARPASRPSGPNLGGSRPAARPNTSRPSISSPAVSRPASRPSTLCPSANKPSLPTARPTSPSISRPSVSRPSTNLPTASRPPVNRPSGGLAFHSSLDSIAFHGSRVPPGNSTRHRPPGTAPERPSTRPETRASTRPSLPGLARRYGQPARQQHSRWRFPARRQPSRGRQPAGYQAANRPGRPTSITGGPWRLSRHDRPVTSLPISANGPVEAIGRASICRIGREAGSTGHRSAESAR